LFRKFANDFAERNRVQAVQFDESAQQVLINYSWPGNIRELKNIAEQICILSTDKNVSAQELLQFIPENQLSRLPAIGGAVGSNSNEPLSYTERELLYKFIFELKRDVSDLKKFILEMAQNNNVQMPEFYNQEAQSFQHIQQQQPIFHNTENMGKSILINKQDGAQTHVVEEPKSLADMEKEMIMKSLTKHKNKRKNVAMELGISERTLYRKIKEYNIKE